MYFHAVIRKVGALVMSTYMYFHVVIRKVGALIMSTSMYFHAVIRISRRASNEYLHVFSCSNKNKSARF